jgi:hypothetical protein
VARVPDALPPLGTPSDHLNPGLRALPSDMPVKVRVSQWGEPKEQDGLTTDVPGLAVTAGGGPGAWTIVHLRSGVCPWPPATQDRVAAVLHHPWIREADWSVSGRCIDDWLALVRERVLRVTEALERGKPLPDPGGCA